MREGKPLRKKVYVIAADKTIQMGSGRKEFNPRDKNFMENIRIHLEELIIKAGTSVLKQLDPNYNKKNSEVAKAIDSGYLGNFMMALYNNNQGHRPGFLVSIHPDLEYISTTGTEGACASGGLALAAGIKDILSNQSDLALILGVEEQNTVKAVYGADFLAGAGWVKGMRKDGYAHFFPGQLSKRVDAYVKKFGNKKKLRDAMTEWVVTMYNNGNIDPKSQIYRHGMSDEQIRKLAEKIDPENFVKNLSALDCSKVTDAAAGLILSSEEGIEELRKKGTRIFNITEIIGYGQSGRDITKDPKPDYKLGTTESAVKKAYESAGITKEDIGLVEVHDCFSNIGVMMLEAAGFAKYGKGWKFILDGNIKSDGKLPVNTFGGLISGHPVGETGVRQAVDIYNQLTEKAGANQVVINPDKPYALSINMGGDDGTSIAIIYKNKKI